MSTLKIVSSFVETVADFIFLGSKITADGYSSHEIKSRLLLGRKVMTNLDSILKSRDTCRTEKETQMYRTDFWALWEKERVG